MTDWRDLESLEAKAAARRRLEWRATLRQQLPAVTVAAKPHFALPGDLGTDPIAYLQQQLGAQVVSVTPNPRRNRKAA